MQLQEMKIIHHNNMNDLISIEMVLRKANESQAISGFLHEIFNNASPQRNSPGLDGRVL